MWNTEKINKKIETKNNLNVSKEELKNLEKELEIKKQFKNLENEVIINNYPTLFPEYKKELQKYEKDPETLKWYVFLLDLWKKFLWTHTFEVLSKSLPFKEIVPFIYEMIKIEKEKDLLQTATIVLTNEEIKELKQLLASNATKKRLTEFIEKQLFENVTTAELIKWTSLEKKFNQVNENPYKTVNNIDYIWYKFLQNEDLNISNDSLRNMATGITLTLSFIYAKTPAFQEINLESLKNPKVLTDFLIKNKNKVKSIKEKLDNLFEVIRELKLWNKSEQYEVLMDPYKFHLLMMKLFSGASKEEIKQEIIKSKKDKNIIPNHEEIKKETYWIFNNLWKKLSLSNTKTIAKFSNLVEKIKWAKENVKDYLFNSADYLFELKDSLENFWGIDIWKYIKKFIDFFFKFLGFKNWWDDFEKEVKEKEFKNVLEYIKNKCSIKEIKKEKNSPNPSIFYEWFKDKIDILSQIQPKWELSYQSLKYLKAQDLNNFFEWKNFKKLLKQANISEKDFFKKTFSIEETTKGKKKIQIWYIDFKKIDQIIRKTCKTEIYKDPQKEEQVITRNYFTEKENYNINNPEITKIINSYETKFRKNVEMLFWIKNFSYKKYIQAIANIESSWWNYKAVNKEQSWALWKYQFMPSTLWDYKNEICGNKNCSQQQLNEKFLNSPTLQEKIMWEYTMSHLIQIYNLIKQWKLPAPRSLEELIKMLAKSHFTGVRNLSKNYSDWNLKADEYAQKASDNYEVA